MPIASGKRTRILAKVASHGGLIIACCAFMLPLVWMLSTAVKPADQVFDTPPHLLADPPGSTLGHGVDNFRAVLMDKIDGEVPRFGVYVRNTLVIAVLSVPGMVLSSAAAAFGFSRIRWKGRDQVFFFVLITMMIPFPVLMAPLYVIFRDLGWIGSFKPLWVPAWFGHAFNIFLLRQFFLSLPDELDEAARIDGCSSWGIFWRIVLPLSRSALAVVAVFHLLYVWNDFLGPLIFLTHQEDATLALGLQRYQSQHGGTSWSELMAASLLMVLPVLVVFFLAQRTFIEGIATEGLKE